MSKAVARVPIRTTAFKTYDGDTNMVHTTNQSVSQDFDALAFEEERYQIFQQTENSAPLSDSALDADWDCRLGYEPTEAQWHDPAYRAAYIQAIAQKYDEKFGVLI